MSDNIESWESTLSPGNMFAEYYKNNSPQAKFQIGETIKLSSTGETRTVTGINVVDIDEIEYSLAEEMYLFWEYELEKL